VASKDAQKALEMELEAAVKTLVVATSDLKSISEAKAALVIGQKKVDELVAALVATARAVEHFAGPAALPALVALIREGACAQGACAGEMGGWRGMDRGTRPPREGACPLTRALTDRLPCPFRLRLRVRPFRPAPHAPLWRHRVPPPRRPGRRCSFLRRVRRRVITRRV
jgi:hypothetical protein